MKKFLQVSKMPLIVGIVAAILYCLDSLIAPHIIAGASFTWVAFIAWTVTTSMTLKDKIKALIGVVIGFLLAVGIMYFGKLFSANVIGISIAGVLGVFIFNMIALYFDNFKKLWMNSVTGIFMGIALTFSGLGVGLAPNSWANAGILICVLLLYVILGMACATATSLWFNAWNKPKKFSSDTEEGKK